MCTEYTTTTTTKFVYLKENRIKCDKKNSSGNIQRHREKKRNTKKKNERFVKNIPCSRISIWSEENQNNNSNNNKKMEIVNANWQRWQQVNIKIAESTYSHAPHLRSYISLNLNPNAMLLTFGFWCVCVCFLLLFLFRLFYCSFQMYMPVFKLNSMHQYSVIHMNRIQMSFIHNHRTQNPRRKYLI